MEQAWQAGRQGNDEWQRAGFVPDAAGDRRALGGLGTAGQTAALQCIAGAGTPGRLAAAHAAAGAEAGTWSQGRASASTARWGIT